jgi:hypothetical protein
MHSELPANISASVQILLEEYIFADTTLFRSSSGCKQCWCQGG